MSWWERGSDVHYIAFDNNRNLLQTFDSDRSAEVDDECTRSYQILFSWFGLHFNSPITDWAQQWRDKKWKMARTRLPTQVFLYTSIEFPRLVNGMTENIFGLAFQTIN